MRASIDSISCCLPAWSKRVLQLFQASVDGLTAVGEISVHDETGSDVMMRGNGRPTRVGDAYSFKGCFIHGAGGFSDEWRR